ncbi:Conserved_hypothetical protein [Hexamita inflata]|uniref:Uncharacterized protein n=1 Tax=Hexamita inflata TaxID=28002 RepID=A0ABP1L253_9EUKA
MLTRLQLIQFETVLHAMIQFITGKIISSNHQLYNELLQLGQPERRGLWKQIGARIGSNELQVHDYFYNTWQLQFYEDPYLYRSELNLQKPVGLIWVFLFSIVLKIYILLYYIVTRQFSFFNFWTHFINRK